MSPNCGMRRQCDPCGRVTSGLRSLNADGGWRRMNGQPWTPERTYDCITQAQARAEGMISSEIISMLLKSRFVLAIYWTFSLLPAFKTIK